MGSRLERQVMCYRQIMDFRRVRKLKLYTIIAIFSAARFGSVENARFREFRIPPWELTPTFLVSSLANKELCRLISTIPFFMEFTYS